MIEQSLITFSDILVICRRSKRMILLSILICSSLALLYTLTRPVEYRGEATFREKAKTGETSKSSALASFIGIPELNENAAISLMKSRKLIERTIRKRDLQAKIVPAGLNLEIVRNIPKNLIAEYAHFIDAESPLIPDLAESLKARQISYSQESPLILKLHFLSDEQFIVLGNGEIGRGRVGERFEGPNFAFTLTRLDGQPLEERMFKLTLKPVSMVAEELNEKVSAEPDNTDKGLLNLTFAHRNRHEAYQFLNTLMGVYQEYLREEHQRITGDQVAYLHKRQEETALKLQAMMREHAESLSENMASIEFLFHNQQSFSQKLLLIDFELKRLDKALQDGLANYDKLGVETGDPTIINQMLGEIRRHKQHADTLDMALRHIPQEDGANRKRAFSDHMRRLETVRQQNEEAQKLLAAVENQQPIPSAPSLKKSPGLMLQEWLGKLAETKQAWQKAAEPERHVKAECLETCHRNFQAYLANLIRLFHVEERLLQERLSHNQSPLAEFQGINLNSASQIYVNYSKSLNDIEAEILHFRFILDQMQDPSFEPSSLSSVLEDPVSREIISRAGSIGLQLKDEANHSPRELERLKLDLAQQKEFLNVHAQQTLQLLLLRQKLYQEKLIALQSTTRELLQQEIALIEKNLSDYLTSRIGNLQHEKSVIEQQQLALRQTMQKMPVKWAAEKLIDQQLETNRKMVEEIAKMVESKNIALNIDLSQSAPIDSAILPLNPQSRKPLLFLIVGAFLGAFASVGFVLARAVATGLPATQESLTLLGQHMAGPLSTRCGDLSKWDERDLDTLRRAEAHLCQQTQKSQTLLLLIGKGCNYSLSFAQLLKKSGKRVLLLPISFDTASQVAELPGLLQYLEGEAAQPKILPDDHIAGGGISRFSLELLLSERFQELLQRLSGEYDWIIAISRSPLESGEAETLFGLFQHALISIGDAKLKSLKPFLHRAEEKRVSFVLNAQA